MDKQEKRIIIRIDELTKTNFNKLCDKKHITLSGRIKYLIQMDIDNKIIINNGD
jgi:hypothetical protein